MKLFRTFILPAIVTFSLLIICANSNKLYASNNQPKTTPDAPPNPSDAVYKRIQEYIHSLAEEQMKSKDIMKKRKLAGALPEGFPEDVVKNALKTRKDKSKWWPILGIPTEYYRICLYPFARVNYVKWCNNNFFGAKNKADTCYYNFCQVCCDHLDFVFQNAAEKNVIGELLQLNQEQGIKAIRDHVDKTNIHNCKVSCKKNYPVVMPRAQSPPPRDPELGTEKKPGVSCVDILVWGPENAKSGVYWIELQAKGPQKAFCDMETDKGGWTLFFNYLHQPGEEMRLNENKLPIGLKQSSHMYLDNAGFTKRDVKEVRFLCTERFKGKKKFWHFKTTNKDILKVAMNSDQTILRAPSSISMGYVEMKPPSSIQGAYVSAVEKNNVSQFDIVGRNPKGGFTATVFGSFPYEANWTVKGDLPTMDVFECGTNHKNPSPSPEDSPNMVFTHHSIWFRGNPLSNFEARKRFMNNIAK